ncbi:MAG TPA: hypothetical protein VMF12_05320 [Xanthobacteraceae bacterium]|nr:hypothetical protein [Xanthobacteraceae bacterium]
MPNEDYLDIISTLEFLPRDPRLHLVQPTLPHFCRLPSGDAA